MKRWLAFAPLAVIVGAILLFGVYALKRNPQVITFALKDKAMPEMVLPDLASGQMRSLTEVVAQASQRPDGSRGPVIVNFYGSWCVGCVAESPELLALSQEGVKIVGVAWKDEPAASKQFLARYGDPFVASLVDRDNRLGMAFGVTGAPESYLIGPDGRVLAKHAAPFADVQQGRDLLAGGGS